MYEISKPIKLEISTKTYRKSEAYICTYGKNKICHLYIKTNTYVQRYIETYIC